MLIDPTDVPDAMTLMPGTIDPKFESFFVADNHMVLNIIDSPGLFERGSKEQDIRDNMVIMRTIEDCINHEITKLHVICFCMSFTTGLHQEDVETVRLLINFLGEDISRNSCLILTRCESMDEEQRNRMKKELLEDAHFKKIAPYFKKGIFFSGAINRDHFMKGYEIVKDQFDVVNEYRNRLIDFFVNENEPLPINQTLINAIQEKRNKE
jgi:hypothetical protein